MRSPRVVGAFLLTALFPAFVLAQTSTTNAQLSAILAEISQLEQQITALTNASSSTAANTPAPAATTPASSSYTGDCPNLSENLSLGSSGPDVANLQAFLAGQGLFGASVTGYFGSITQRAVQEWQTSHSIVSGGDPASTGFGTVGPRTRSVIALMCGYSASQQNNNCIATQPPTTECPTSWQPVTASNGCTMYYQCSISLPVASSSSSSSVVVGAATSSPGTCPVVVKPQCSGQVVPFQTNTSGCVTSYECVL